jgi:LTXXQ motif family protein
MLKIVATALLLAASPLAYAQTASQGASSTGASNALSAADWSNLTDLRIDLVKGALQLTPEQTKYWPAIESAIRTRAQDRHLRLSRLAETVGAKAEESRIERWRNRDPVNFLQRRAENLAQRSADLKKLADAWEPLYQTLSPEQKRRMAALSILVLREMHDAIEQHLIQSDDED